MLAAKNLLEALSEESNPQDGKYDNDDHDFGEVLKFCGDDNISEHILRYPDGREEIFRLNNKEN